MPAPGTKIENSIVRVVKSQQTEANKHNIYSSDATQKIVNFLTYVRENGFNYEAMMKRIGIKSHGTNTVKECEFRDFCRRQIIDAEDANTLKLFLEEICSMLYFYFLFNAVFLGDNDGDLIQFENKEDVIVLQRCFQNLYDEKHKGTRNNHADYIPSENLFPSIENVLKFLKNQVSNKVIEKPVRRNAELLFDAVEAFTRQPHLLLHSALEFFFAEAIHRPLSNKITTTGFKLISASICGGTSFIFDNNNEVVVHISLNISHYVKKLAAASRFTKEVFSRHCFLLKDSFETAYDAFLARKMPPAKNELLNTLETLETSRNTSLNNSSINQKKRKVDILLSSKSNVGEESLDEEWNEKEEFCDHSDNSDPNKTEFLVADDHETTTDENTTFSSTNLDNEETFYQEQPPFLSDNKCCDTRRDTNSAAFGNNHIGVVGKLTITPTDGDTDMEMKLYVAFYKGACASAKVGLKCYTAVKEAIREAFEKGKSDGYVKTRTVKLLLQVCKYYFHYYYFYYYFYYY